MKPFFIPNALIAATEKVRQAHPKTAWVVEALSAQDLKALVLAIDEKELALLPAFAMTLSLRQRTALCGYLPLNTYKVSLEKVQYVLSSNMTLSMYQRLFELWEDAPSCKEVLSLLGQTAKNPTYQTALPIPGTVMVAWAQSPNPFYAVAITCQDRGQGVHFLDCLKSAGLSAHKSLAMACFAAFLQRGKLAVFQKEGDDVVSTLLANLPTAQQRQILMQLLFCCKENPSLLGAFHELYNHAYRLWGEPNVSKFPQGRQWEYDTYLWWYNYRQIQIAFHGQKRRIQYWKQYLHLCTCQRRSTHSMLVMHYATNVVIEFEEMGPVYIFDKDYFDVVVELQLKSLNTQNLKSWLKNFSNYKSREVHQIKWEYAQTSALRRCRVIS